MEKNTGFWVIVTLSNRNQFRLLRIEFRLLDAEERFNETWLYRQREMVHFEQGNLTCKKVARIHSSVELSIF